MPTYCWGIKTNYEKEDLPNEGASKKEEGEIEEKEDEEHEEVEVDVEVVEEEEEEGEGKMQLGGAESIGRDKETTSRRAEDVEVHVEHEEESSPPIDEYTET